MSDLLVRFAARLREAGLDVPLDCVVNFARAVEVVGLDRRDDVYWSGRATLVRRPEDFTAYDAAFVEFWESRAPSADVFAVARSIDEGGARESGGSGTDDDPEDDVVVWSAQEVLRHKDLAACSPEELLEAERLIGSLRLSGPRRRSRRLRPSNRRDRLDLRRTVHAALRSGNEPVRLAWQSTGERRRRVVVLVDVSGSMAPYARALLRFAHVAAATRRGLEVFALATRLTRLTTALTTHDADAAMDAAAAAIPDLEGGTRLGETIAEFTNRWGVRGMARGAVVVIVSDGWDRGDSALLGEHMARLSRVAHRVVWVNPLKASPGYAPLTAGMAAALPWVDEFVEGHAVASLEDLAGMIAS
ncbi:MAG TPA: VWA domain-containing protein [Acidimicrobiales bacterium]|nr:VWA domain-containing protein [Acidimicrobiales bacterium]